MPYMNHIEIEFKMLITQQIYQQIVKAYESKISGDYIQTNYYLFHPQFDENKYSLRIRKKNNQYELTLKTPSSIGLHEYNEIIDEHTKNQIFAHKHVSNPIFKRLETEGIDYHELECGHYLTTHRIDIPFQYGILSLDANEYNGIQDYELEFEVNDYQKGYQQFLDIITPFHLTYTENCLSKTRRMKASLKQKST